ncbi:MAG: UMP kinase [Candidatus Nanohaloarchaeota archaeon QJJ-7]|nr:UMP kinase [Candidatus Nanohaloarchaeota archaeon QJJ-7]
MDLVVSLGGKVLTDALEKDNLEDYVEAFQELEEETDNLVIVTGAGGLKKYIDAASEFGISESEKDLIGIKATRLHASLLSSALDANVTVPENLEKVAELAKTQDTVVLGGLIPGQSTDAVAAECAEIIGADRLVLATTVDGVYDADPEEDSEAERYGSMGYDELLELVTEKETSAGSYALVDILAAKLIQRSGLETIVLDGRDPATITTALDENPSGTRIG